MVRKINVSRYNGTPPETEKDDRKRKIAGGPLYPADEVLALLANGEGTVTPWPGCAKDMQKWSLDTRDALELIGLAVRHGKFIASEWCEHGLKGPWAACDAYRVFRHEEIKYKKMLIEYYIKFAIAKSGILILLISFHPSE